MGFGAENADGVIGEAGEGTAFSTGSGAGLGIWMGVGPGAGAAAIAGAVKGFGLVSDTGV